jgi:hypothetical protein
LRFKASLEDDEEEADFLVDIAADKDWVDDDPFDKNEEDGASLSNRAAFTTPEDFRSRSSFLNCLDILDSALLSAVNLATVEDTSSSTLLVSESSSSSSESKFIPKLKDGNFSVIAIENSCILHFDVE